MVRPGVPLSSSDDRQTLVLPTWHMQRFYTEYRDITINCINLQALAYVSVPSPCLIGWSWIISFSTIMTLHWLATPFQSLCKISYECSLNDCRQAPMKMGWPRAQMRKWDLKLRLLDQILQKSRVRTRSCSAPKYILCPANFKFPDL